MKQRKLWVGMIVMIAVGHAYASSSIFTISPSVSAVTTEGSASTSIIYTVTNNTTQTIQDLTIDPSYSTTGNPDGLTMQNNTCSGVVVGKSSRTFGLIIQGANQPSSFIVTPKVCVDNSQACSYAGSAGQLNVTVYPATTSYA